MSKVERVKALLESGRTIDMQEFNSVSFRYGSIFHRLRHEHGWVIETIPIDRKSGHFAYRLGGRPLVYVEQVPRTDASSVSLVGGQI